MKKITIIAGIILVLAGASYMMTADDNSEKIMLKNAIYKFYSKNQQIKIKKEISRKIYSKEFNEIISDFSVAKLETVNYLVSRDSLKNSLNSESKVTDLRRIELPSIEIREAEQILIISRELSELENVSKEMKTYLEKKYKGFDYSYFAKKGDKIVSFIRDREGMYSQLPDSINNILRKLSPQKAEIIKEIIHERKIPNSIQYSTADFTEFKLDYTTMDDLYNLSKNLRDIGVAVPEFVEEINKLYPNLDYTRIALNGKYYLNDKKAMMQIEKEYSEKEYSFEQPYIKVNPYNRVENSALIKCPDLENEVINVTIKGKNGQEDLKYKISHKNEIEIYGLYMNSDDNTVILNNGEKEVILKIKTEKIPNELPIISVNQIDKLAMSPGLTYVTYLSGINCYGIMFDEEGNIRYLFNPNPEENSAKWFMQRNEKGFLYFDQERVFQFSYLGKIMNSWSKFNYENIAKVPEYARKGYPDRSSQLLLENKQTLNTINFINSKYAMGQISEINLETNKVVFNVEIYFDKNDERENKIALAERIKFPN